MSSPKDVRVLLLLLLLGSKLSVGAKLEEGISEVEGVIEGTSRDSRFERKDVLKIDSIPNFNNGVVGYFTNLIVNH